MCPSLNSITTEYHLINDPYTQAPSIAECSCSILLDQARGSPTLTCQLFQSEYENQSAALPGHHRSEQCIARLVVSGDQGHFTLSNDTSADEHFFVDAMELLRIDLLEDRGYSSD